MDYYTKRVECNYTPDSKGGTCEYAEVFKDGIISIIYHEAEFDGDTHYCQIVDESGRVWRVFNLSYVELLPEEEFGAVYTE